MAEIRSEEWKDRCESETVGEFRIDRVVEALSVLKVVVLPRRKNVMAENVKHVKVVNLACGASL